MEASPNRRRTVMRYPNGAIEDELDRLLESWIDEIETGSNVSAKPHRTPQPAQTATTEDTDDHAEAGRGPCVHQGAVTSGGSLVFQSKDGASCVVLVPHGETMVHRGTLGLEEGLARAGGWPAEQLAPDRLAGLRFAVRWFGAPVDAVDVARNGGLAWGFWRLKGDELGAALAEVRARAPEAWAGGEEPDVATTAHPLGAGVKDGSLAFVPAAVPREVVRLARLGRTPQGLLAQIKVVTERLLAPLHDAFATGAEQEGAPEGTGVGAPGMGWSRRHWAALYALAMTFGARTTIQIAQPLWSRTQEEPLSFYLSLMDRLDGAGHLREATHIARVLSSPELELR